MYGAAKLGRHEACTQFHMHSLILIFNNREESAEKKKKKHISEFGIHYLSECEPFRPELMQETQATHRNNEKTAFYRISHVPK